MKRKAKITCGVLAGLLLTVGAVAYWQRNNVDALLKATRYSAEEIEEKRKENQQKVQEKVDAQPALTVRDLTEEERQALREGSITQEELTEKLVEAVKPQSTPETSKEQTTTPATSAPTQTPASSAPAETPPSVEPPVVEPAQWDKDLSALIARVYVLREEYTIALDNIQSEAKAEYRAMAAEERTKTALMKFARGYVTRALELEKECDAQMDDVVSRMETIIRENKGDMTLVDTVVETYASEKSLKKAWYMAELEKRGWI